jgi:hypothetical protein
VKTFKSAHYLTVNTLAFVATDTSHLYIYDNAGNLLDQYSLEPGTKIKSVSTPIHPDDMTMAVLTESDNLYTLKLVITDIFPPGTTDEEKKRSKTSLATHQEIGFQAGEEKRVNVRELFKDNVKTDPVFKQVVSSRARGKMFINVLDSDNFVTVFHKDSNFIGRYYLGIDSSDPVV